MDYVIRTNLKSRPEYNRFRVINRASGRTWESVSAASVRRLLAMAPGGMGLDFWPWKWPVN